MQRTSSILVTNLGHERLNNHMISHEHKCIFIHIPKCAGSSIEKSIVKKDWWRVNQTTKHMLADKAKKVYNEYWNDYFKFAFVRNPWEVEVSWYFWRLRGWGCSKRSTRGMSFEDFVIQFDITAATPWVPNTSLFLDYLTDSSGAVMVDFIGRVENFQEDFDTVCDKIGIPRQELPHTNKTKHKHYTEYYDDETKEIVAEKYAQDIEYFGYKFGE